RRRDHKHVRVGVSCADMDRFVQCISLGRLVRNHEDASPVVHRAYTSLAILRSAREARTIALNATTEPSAKSDAIPSGSVQFPMSPESCGSPVVRLRV